MATSWWKYPTNALKRWDGSNNRWRCKFIWATSLFLTLTTPDALHSRMAGTAWHGSRPWMTPQNSQSFRDPDRKYDIFTHRYSQENGSFLGCEGCIMSVVMLYNMFERQKHLIAIL
jgi:hypothetical protein